MQIKFMPKDVIGKKPTKVGDKFNALFMGFKTKFVVVEYYGDFFMSEML